MSGGAVERLRADVEGTVQGVGFRPFVFRLAEARGLSGWVRNTPSGVAVEVEGPREETAAFLRDLRERAPPLAALLRVRTRAVPPLGTSVFVILPSDAEETGIPEVAPDGDVCEECLAELFDPRNRRYRYPFINCTNCGPRYTIVRALPYDRPRTTMASFELCAACRAEYEDPSDRRFHAQPLACPACGPTLSLRDPTGRALAGDPLALAAEALAQGRLLAVKGVGGFHLAANACDERAVAELRTRKKRDEKPFAVMSPGLSEVATYARCGRLDRRLLESPERPVVLLPKREPNPLSPLVAPVNGYFGVMLPYTPLHHLLLRGHFLALVMTSGNLSDEPIVRDDAEALERLAGIADLFLTHDRPIHVRADDSVLRVFRGKPLFLRRARGYAPRPLALPAEQASVLAVGAELKSALCLTRGARAFLSQHLGDLQGEAVLRSFEDAVEHLTELLGIRPEVVAHDLHPDYLSTVYAEERPAVRRVAVQHHHAHLASCMAENGLEGEVIGITFDGAGFGPDGSIWGGEFLAGGYASYRRLGHLRQVPLLGGDLAAREPYRMALAYLHDAYGRGLLDLPLPFLRQAAGETLEPLLTLLDRRLHATPTSSCGRLFDAVAALLGLRARSSYEGQAALELEALAEREGSAEAYPFSLGSAGAQAPFEVDVRPMFGRLLADLAEGRPAPGMARRFHNTLAAAAAEGCEHVRRETGLRRVVLSGGVFQNRVLTETTLAALEGRGFQVFTHRLVPPNDGGIALGQAVVAGRS